MGIAAKELLDPGNYPRYMVRILKEGSKPFRSSSGASRPIFLFGLQRSGTTMMMHVLQSCPDVLVYNEHRDSRVFERCLLRSEAIVQDSIDDCPYPFVAYKPISDSHRAAEILNVHGPARGLWMYRDFHDVANSSERKWGNSTRAITIVCRGESGGGWFQEGVSADVQETLRRVYSPSLSQHDLLCLVWWARNRLYFEQELQLRSDVLLVNYDRLVGDSNQQFAEIMSFLGVRYRQWTVNQVHGNSRGRHTAARLNRQVEELCSSLKEELDTVARAQAASGTSTGEAP